MLQAGREAQRVKARAPIPDPEQKPFLQGDVFGMQEGVWSAYYLTDDCVGKKPGEMRYVGVLKVDARTTAVFYLQHQGHQHYVSKGQAAVLPEPLAQVTPEEVLESFSFRQRQGIPTLYFVAGLQCMVWEQKWKG